LLHKEAAYAIINKSIKLYKDTYGKK
jgi:hypothetical protein